MNEIQLLSLIAGGETEVVDFKELLNLKTNDDKAEFIKDVNAIANSSKKNGYLLIGVDDNKIIQGISTIDEERIQQIVSTYLTPVPIVKCEQISVLDAGFQNVGVIEIWPTEKPHKIARAISRLKKDQVFIRHGTTTAQASPDELFRMKEYENSSQYAKAGETHLKLSGFENAIASFSRAIEITPMPHLFLKRAEAYIGLAKDKTLGDRSKLSKKALKDLNDGIEISDHDAQLVHQIREFRYKNFSWLEYDLDERMKDFESSIYSIENEARADWILNEIDEVHVPYDDYVIDLLHGLIESEDLQVKLKAYRLLADVHESNHNYGLTLTTIEDAMQFFREKFGEFSEESNILDTQISVLLEIGKYNEADEKARELKNKLGNHASIPIPTINESDLLLRLAWTSKHGDDELFDGDLFLLKILTAIEARRYNPISYYWSDLEKTTELELLQNSFSDIQHILKEATGPNFWMALSSDDDIHFSIPPLD